MVIRRDVIAFASLRRLAAQLLVALLCLRALIPAGFMTDASAAKDGVFRIVICSAHAAATSIDIDFGTDGEPQQSAPAHDQPCAFAGLAIDVSDSVQGYTILKPRVATVARIHSPRHALMPPVRAGPLLGSRAPPAVS